MLFGKSPFFHENSNIMYGKIMEEDPQFPKEPVYSADSVDFIKKLLRKNGQERIGFDDEQEIFTHAWFNDIVFSKLIEKQIPAKIIPHVDEEVAKLFKMKAQEEPEKKLDLSFERQPERRKASHTGSRTDSGEGFSYFEEEEFVETAVQEEESETESAEEQRRQKFLDIIYDEPVSDEEPDFADNCFGSLKDTVVKAADKLIARKGSLHQLPHHFSPADKKPERRMSGSSKMSESSEGALREDSNPGPTLLKLASADTDGPNAPPQTTVFEDPS
jgi:hypothetical protein